MSGKTEKTMKQELEKSYYVKTCSTKKTFRKYSTERKIKENQSSSRNRIFL